MHMDLDDLAKRIAMGERRALARGITLVESSRSDHRVQAAHLLGALPQDRQALRIGMSGTPGGWGHCPWHCRSREEAAGGEVRTAWAAPQSEAIRAR